MWRADWLGQEVQRITVHQPMFLHRRVGVPLQCYGAMVLWTESAAMILRSPLRYGNPTLSAVVRERSPEEPATTVCSHEEAEWLTMAIGRRWQSIPTENFRIKTVAMTASAVSLVNSEEQAYFISYRHDFDASWLMTAEVDAAQRIETLDVKDVASAFGWLLPEAPYSLLWNGRRWQNLAVAWVCANRHVLHPVKQGALFQQLYRMRLEQHPNLLRRFAALQYPVHCGQWPWVAKQIEQMRVAGPPPLTNSDQDWRV